MQKFHSRARRTLPALVHLGLVLAAPLTAQAGAGGAPRGVISGSVLDAQTSLPLPGVTVVVEPEAAGALPTAEGAFLRSTRGVLTDSAGGYRFEDLAPGRYRLRVSRTGYRPATVGVELRGWADSRVSIGLTVEPIPLETIEVTAERAQAYGRDRDGSAEVDGSRIRSARARREASLSTDARELTHADVVESVTLGETDLFRAFQRLPGVSTRDDYTAELWTRGASWDQTRVLFDGLPLLNPLHGMGVFSAVNTDAVGGAVLHPGVRPASLGEGAAGVVDVTSRRGGGDGALRGMADVSLASARLALDQRATGGRAAWMVAARRSYLDWLAAAVGELADEREARVPYAYQDLTTRLDVHLPGGRALEASGLWERDRITGDLPDVLHRTRAGWGNALGRLTYASPAGGVLGRYTLGYSRYDATVREAAADSALEDEYSAPDEPRSDNAVDQLQLSAEFAPAMATTTRARWRGGFELLRQTSRYEGPPARAHAGYEPVDAPPITMQTVAVRGALWAERRWGAGERLAIDAGLRLEAGEPLANAGAVRLAPRLSARLQLNPEVALSAGIGRSYQYLQALGPTGPAVSSAFHASHLWLPAGDGVPAIRADVATLGAEAWLGGVWLAAANAYLRRATGMAVADPTPGLLRDRPLFVVGENAARGVELSARKLAGSWTASLAYTYGASNVEAAGLVFPAPSDRRHALDATAMLRVGGSLRVGAAYSSASGAPFTRVYSHAWSCAEGESDCYLPRIGEPNAQRTPAYSSLDLLVDWTRRFSAWDLSLYLQIRNALRHDNAVTYLNSSEICPGRGFTSVCPTGHALVDNFQAGLPLLPVLGFRAKF